MRSILSILTILGLTGAVRADETSSTAVQAVVPAVCADAAVEAELFLDAPRGEPLPDAQIRRLTVSYAQETTIQRSRYFNWNRIFRDFAASRANLGRDDGDRADYCADAFLEHGLRYAERYYGGIVRRCHDAFFGNQPGLFNARSRGELFARPDFKLHCVDGDAPGSAGDRVRARLDAWDASLVFLRGLRTRSDGLRAAESPTVRARRQALAAVFGDTTIAPAAAAAAKPAGVNRRAAAYDRVVRQGLNQPLSGTYGHAGRVLSSAGAISYAGN